MLSSHSTVCDQMPVSLETLGDDILLEVVSWLSRFDLLHLLMTVRFFFVLIPDVWDPPDISVLLAV